MSCHGSRLTDEEIDDLKARAPDGQVSDDEIERAARELDETSVDEPAAQRQFDLHYVLREQFTRVSDTPAPAATIARLLSSPDSLLAAFSLSTLCHHWGRVRDHRDTIIEFLTDPRIGLFDDRRDAGISAAAEYLRERFDREMATLLVGYALGQAPFEAHAGPFLMPNDYPWESSEDERTWALRAVAQALGDSSVEIANSAIRQADPERWASGVLERARERWGDLGELVNGRT